MNDTALVWFRRDLRLTDNPALSEAVDQHRKVIPLYVHAPDEEQPWASGGASQWWLHHALGALDAELRSLGSRLLLRRGPVRQVLADIAEESGARAIYWNRLYDPATIARDKAVKHWAEDAGLETTSCNAALLHEPWQIANGQGLPYRVFTPFWKACRGLGGNEAPLPAPDAVETPQRLPPSERLEALELLPRIRWDQGLEAAWTPGERAAGDQLDRFLDEAADDYASQRDRPGVTGTSRLSPHLHFGEISPRQVLWACQERRDDEGVAEFVRELYWREFAHHLLYHFPHTTQTPLDERFVDFPWRDGVDADLAAWQQGRTGIPLVDAGMRELWQTGWMHNRVRMVVASLLTKNLLIPWQTGAEWFWDTLVDADLANNTLGWQWTAGCGADAAPFFRIFNPVAQGERFDPKGDYVRRWVPELAALPDKWLHKPWAAPGDVLQEANIALGDNYPQLIVDLKDSRKRALAAWDRIRNR